MKNKKLAIQYLSNIKFSGDVVEYKKLKICRRNPEEYSKRSINGIEITIFIENSTYILVGKYPNKHTNKNHLIGKYQVKDNNFDLNVVEDLFKKIDKEKIEIIKEYIESQ